MLKSSQCVAETKGYYIVFKVTLPSSESCLPFFSFGHSEQVVTISHVQGREAFCLTDLVQELRDQGEGVSVLDRDLVDSAVIHAETEAAVSLLDKEDGGTGGGLGVSDEPFP